MKFHELNEECKCKVIELIKDGQEEIDEQSGFNNVYSKTEIIEMIEENNIDFKVEYDKYNNCYISYA